MSDASHGPRDRGLGGDYDRIDRTLSRGVTEQDLRAAFRAVGNSADKVWEYLKQREAEATGPRLRTASLTRRSSSASCLHRRRSSEP